MTSPDLDLRTARAIESIAAALDRIATTLERKNAVSDDRAMRGTRVDSHHDRGRRKS
jgi:hypothetical protein